MKNLNDLINEANTKNQPIKISNDNNNYAYVVSAEYLNNILDQLDTYKCVAIGLSEPLDQCTKYNPNDPW